MTEYRKYLTPAEKQKLAAGHPIEKLHSSYWRSHPSPLYWQGNLRVQPVGLKGKLKFTPMDHWLQYCEDGQILSDATYTLSNKQGHIASMRVYYPAGVLRFDEDNWAVVLDGDSVVKTRFVTFRGGKETDTSYIETYYTKNKRPVGERQRSFDLAGRKPVPKGWRPE